MEIPKDDEGIFEDDFERFKTWCDENSIDDGHEDDWGPWWNCFKAGVQSGGVI